MMQLSLAEIAAATGAYGDTESSSELMLAGVSTDSRTVEPGQLFVCLRGERFDGHAFARDAVAKGASAVLAERPLPEVMGLVPVMVAPDSLAALGRLAGFWRARTRAKVAALTGSAGKTTVKELLAAALAESGATAKTRGNLNNRIGAPMTMLACTGQERFWVLELGINYKGEMAELAGVVRPDLAVIHNIGPAHLEGLGDLAGVAREKASLLRFLAPGGEAVVSMDHPLLWQEARTILERPVGFSCRGKDAAYAGRVLGREGHLTRFGLLLAGEELEVALPLVGAHFCENVLAAAAAAHRLGASVEQIGRGLARAELPAGRFRCVETPGGCVIDDSYNANPLSMRASLDAARELAGGRPLVLVLGEMRELGPSAPAEHRALGRAVAASPARALFWRGGYGEDVRQGLDNGGWKGVFATVDSEAELASRLDRLGLEGPVILVKASRSLGLDRYAAALAAGRKGDA
ncbi:MAG: UDP-N-acetylmuramoyl-tripeptide--D-alanyl-D-alanine ligase [Thermodesulfobacteriota bacterium]